MPLPESFKSQMISYLYGSLSLNTLRERLAPFAIDAGDSRDPESLRLANGLIGNFSDFDEGHLKETELKQNLYNLLFGASTSSYMEIKLDYAAPAIRTGTATSGSGEAAPFGSAGRKRATVFA